VSLKFLRPWDREREIHVPNFQLGKLRRTQGMQGRGEWGEGNHHIVRGKDLERKKAYCLYCDKPVSELAVRLSLVDEIFR
jgi:hypothetical protein